jgi:predicted alpha/beta-hydrolase family hydrolase
VSTLQHYPAENPSNTLLVLAHGAGAGQRHPFMVTMACGLAERGIDVATFDFPYMREKRRVPDKAPVLEAAFREAVVEALDRSAGALRHTSTRLFIGGKSMGGRMATHLAAQGLDGLAGVVALGYPLHPPGKPEQPRIAHLPAIRVPMLIVQGERDAFGTPDELKPVIGQMTARVMLHVVARGDHSLAVAKTAGVAQKDVYATVLDTIASWVQST